MRFFGKCPDAACAKQFYIRAEGKPQPCSCGRALVDTDWANDRGRILYQVRGNYPARLVGHDDETCTLTANNFDLTLPAGTVAIEGTNTFSSTTPLSTNDNNSSWFSPNLDGYKGGGRHGARRSLTFLHDVQLLLGRQTDDHAGFGLVHIMYNHPKMLGRQAKKRELATLLAFTRKMTADPNVRESADKLIKVTEQDNQNYAVHGAAGGNRMFCVVTRKYGNVMSINTFYAETTSLSGLGRFSGVVRSWERH
jgi:hypothetical protein